MNYKIFKITNRSVFTFCVMFLALVSCYDSGYDEFVPPTGNVNNIQPNTLFTTSTSADDTMSFVFRSYSTDAASYLWDFGDGNTSTEANPNYTYQTGGEYTVTLTTKSSDGLVAEDSSDVAPIFVDFNISKIDSEVTFENLTSGAKSLVWDFGDGETLEWDAEDSEEDPKFNPVHTYKTAETFKATLTATTFLGVQVSISKNIEGLVLSTIPDFTFAVSGFNVQFTDASILAVSHSWDFGDGNTSTEVNPMHMYAGEGTYEVTLTTTNDAGVSKTITQSVPIGGIEATFAAKILNGSIDEITGTDLNDNADAFDMTPNSTVKDASGSNVPSPFAGWKNSTLNTWIEDNISTSNEAPGGSSTAHSAPRALKLHEIQRRAYQPFAVEVGVEYTVKLWVRAEGAGELSVYIMDNEIPDETTLESGNLSKLVVTGGVNNSDSFEEYSFTFVATSTTALFYGKPGDNASGDNEVWIDDISIVTPGFDESGNPTGVTATVEAKILNGSIDEITGTDLNDNADAFDMTPNSTVKDASGSDVPSPFAGWKNSTLNTWIEDNISTSNEAPGGSSTAHSAPRALKLHEIQRRAYQPFAVEVGVEYTVKLWVRAEGAGELSVYIMDNEIPDETTLESSNLSKLVVTGGVNNSDSFEEYSFTFVATSTTALFYGKPGANASGDNEVWIDDISIETPGF
ncbi:PKD domain-containing protein [Algibacter amylolyticus]|uniref:PKD domain-containing protein n=1 Tax=Algibacter amylolyticus TaxID=1608400 RepID=UPI00155A82CC|nr:PKD domain-containing protein [Algibacter amylolyticus]MBB5268613.1 PKD repeat protein [Algibacter amylolyticus]